MYIYILGQQARYAAPPRRHGSGLNFLFCLDWAGGVFAGWALLCLWIGLLPHVVFVAVRETGERRFQEPRRASSARARVARGAAERCRPSPSRAHSIKSKLARCPAQFARVSSFSSKLLDFLH